MTFMRHVDSIPVIDLFAGPGGLGEGFSAVTNPDGTPSFKLVLSIEKDPVAHRTLMLRSVFRQLRSNGQTDDYYAYMRGELDSTRFRTVPNVSAAFDRAANEARCIELGKIGDHVVNDLVAHALAGNDIWILIGGPPCQAYSVVGRARRTNDRDFDKDEKHFLYRQYLHVIETHRPPLFVMENVRGMLSSRHRGELIFQRILRDLSNPGPGLRYEIRSFVKNGSTDTLEPTDYLISSDEFGIPQCRDRVILLGVRKDWVAAPHHLLAAMPGPCTVRQAIGDLPKIRSRVSKEDTTELWWQALRDALGYLSGWDAAPADRIARVMRRIALERPELSTGARFIPRDMRIGGMPDELQRWITDKSIGGVCQHEARGHMRSDLARYLFASSYAAEYDLSPSLSDFPPQLLPDHQNVRHRRQGVNIPFEDRFRVQCADHPASTVVSHIAKDGHYFIHYDPSQCRSLTVREAARLQTFPDNYFFEGNRTQQYTQVGNAVPPLLAFKLGEIVRDLVGAIKAFF